MSQARSDSPSEPESATLSETVSDKPRLKPGTKLPNGKMIVESWPNHQPGARLKVDPKTGKVTRADPEPEANAPQSD
jgi:hypothetical protein